MFSEDWGLVFSDIGAKKKSVFDKILFSENWRLIFSDIGAKKEKLVFDSFCLVKIED